MVLYYLLLAHCLLFYPLLAPAYIFGTLLSSICPLTITIILYYLLLLLCLLYYLLLAPSLYLWYSTTFFWPIAYSTTFYWHPAYTYATLLFLLAHCLWFFTTVYWPTGYTISMVLYYRLLATCRSLWYSTNSCRLPAYYYGTLPPSTGDCLYQ